MIACGWASSCGEEARHTVERETRPGLVLTETVCDGHLLRARAQGYLRRGPAEVEGGDES